MPGIDAFMSQVPVDQLAQHLGLGDVLGGLVGGGGGGLGDVLGGLLGGGKR